MMFHAQQAQAAAPGREVGWIESAPVIANFQSETASCGLYSNFDTGATGMLHGILHGFLQNLVQGRGDLGVEFQGRVDVDAQPSANPPFRAGCGVNGVLDQPDPILPYEVVESAQGLATSEIRVAPLVITAN